MLNDDKTGPLEAALRHMESALSASKGWVKTEGQVADYFKQAGAVDVEVTDFIPGSMSLVTGRKPA